MSSPCDVVGLFAAEGRHGYGGVQASGREAWNAVIGHVGEDRAQAFHYQPGSSRIRAAYAAWRARQRPELILVWHLHLLKLVPLLSGGSARVVVFLHGIEAWDQLGSIDRRLLSQVDHCLSNSKHTWTRFAAANPELGALHHRIVPLGLGAPLGFPAPQPTRPVAVIVGRLESRENYKGHRQLIGAWSRVRQQVPDAELWIVGDGDLRRDLERQAATQGPGSIRFFGAIDEPSKQHLLGEARCLAMPSRGEGFGLVYLEAMRLGRPCLVSDQDAGREVIAPPDAGLAVNPDDPSALAGALVQLLTPSERWDRWSRQAKARYDSEFTAEHFQQRLTAALFGQVDEAASGGKPFMTGTLPGQAAATVSSV